MLRKRYFLFILLAFLLVSCGADGGETVTGAYLPPTGEVSPPGSTASLPTQVIVIAPQATQPVACMSNLHWLEDLTAPDGSLFSPGAPVDKQWLVENNGTCGWDERYRLVLVGGSALGLPENQALYPARAGSQAVIRLIFTAPAEPGSYRSEWQALDPQGIPFGDPIYLEIIVSP